MKKTYKIYIIIMFIVLAVPGISALLRPQKEFSDNENRYLDKFPSASASDILSGEFQDGFTSAFNDQFFIRDFMMGLSTSFKKKLGFKDIGGVYLADGGYYIEKVVSDDIQQDRYVQNLRYVSYFAKKQEADVYTMLVPSPGTVLDDALPAFAPFYNSNSLYNTANIMLGEQRFIDVREALNGQGDVFFKTDHHWTLKGAYQAYYEYCKTAHLGLYWKHPYTSFNPVKAASGFYGTLYSKVLDYGAEPDDFYAIETEETKNARVTCDGEEKTGIYDKESLDKKNKYEYFFGGNYGRIDIGTGSRTGLRLLVIKDSFANSFIPFLLGDYSYITVIDPRYYSGPFLDMTAEGEYDDILILYEISNFAKDNNLYKLVK